VLHETEICAALPVVTWGLHVHRCEVHQAWEIGGYGARFDGQDAIESIWQPATLSLGPFDNLHDLRMHAQGYMDRLLASIVANHH
jgi:hypothetical protein